MIVIKKTTGDPLIDTGMQHSILTTFTQKLPQECQLV